MRYMLDTNTLIYVFNARPQHRAVIERFKRENASDLSVSTVTLAELSFGIAKSREPEDTRRRMLGVLGGVDIVPFSAEAAEIYGGLRTGLEAKGRPIGPLDMLIGAHALSLALTLVTANTREFAKIAGLRLENWIPA